MSSAPRRLRSSWTRSVTHHSSLITHHSSLITHHSSLVTHHSSLITHHSSLVTRHSSLVAPVPAGGFESAQRRVVALGQGADEGVRPGDLRGALHRRARHRHVAQGQVLVDRAAEQLH